VVLLVADELDVGHVRLDLVREVDAGEAKAGVDDLPISEVGVEASAP